MLADAANSAELRPAPVRRSSPPWPRRVHTWLACAVVSLVALLPPLHVVARAVSDARDVAYWDEVETALPLVMRLQEGVTPAGFARELFALNNEHRMVTSRLIYAVSYWTTGTVNFAVITLIGNATILALCGLLIVQAGTLMRRLQLGACLSFVLFTLQHYENILWSGASIDHFQIVLLAGAAIVAVAQRTRGGIALGAAFALLATFTLAHGVLVWAVAGGVLAVERRWRDLLAWGVLATAGVAGFLLGFDVNGAHEFAGTSTEAVLRIGTYWLTLLGAVPSVGAKAVAPWFGGVLLVALGYLAKHGFARRENVAFALACFGVAALALIAFGRAAQSGGVVHSRYLVLSAIAWALTLFMMLQHFSTRGRGWAALACALPVLAVFNMAANRSAAHDADSWVECRDRAALRFKQHGADGRGAFWLFPVPEFATDILSKAEARGVYRMGAVCEPRAFPNAKPTSRISYFVDEMTVNARSAFIGGWAATEGKRSERGALHLVLRGADGLHVFTTVTCARPDVAKATENPDWELSGFRFALHRDRLPTGEFQVGFLITGGGRAEYTMTGHRLVLVGEGQALLAGEAHVSTH